MRSPWTVSEVAYDQVLISDEKRSDVSMISEPKRLDAVSLTRRIAILMLDPLFSRRRPSLVSTTDLASMMQPEVS